MPFEKIVMYITIIGFVIIFIYQLINRQMNKLIQDESKLNLDYKSKDNYYQVTPKSHISNKQKVFIKKFKLFKHYEFIKMLSVPDLVTMLIMFYMFLLNISFNIGMPKIIIFSKYIIYIFMILMILLIIMFLLLRALTLSPKGVIGTVGIVCFIVGNALQLWATFR